MCPMSTYRPVMELKGAELEHGYRYSVLSACCTYPQKKSQNHRIMCAGRNLWRLTGPTFCSKQAQSEQVGQALSSCILSILKDGDFTASLGICSTV